MARESHHEGELAAAGSVLGRPSGAWVWVQHCLQSPGRLASASRPAGLKDGAANASGWLHLSRGSHPRNSNVPFPRAALSSPILPRSVKTQGDCRGDIVGSRCPLPHLVFHQRVLGYMHEGARVSGMYVPQVNGESFPGPSPSAGSGGLLLPHRGLWYRVHLLKHWLSQIVVCAKAWVTGTWGIIVGYLPVPLRVSFESNCLCLNLGLAVTHTWSPGKLLKYPTPQFPHLKNRLQQCPPHRVVRVRK